MCVQVLMLLAAAIGRWASYPAYISFRSLMSKSNTITTALLMIVVAIITVIIG